MARKKREETGLFKEYTPSERLQMLRDNCDTVEEDQQYIKHFTADEISEFKHDLSECAIKIADSASKKKEAMLTFKEAEKPLLFQKSLLIERIRNKSEFVFGDTYKFLDHEEGVATYYDGDGNEINQRPLMPSERQTSILSFNRNTGTNE